MQKNSGKDWIFYTCEYERKCKRLFFQSFLEHRFSKPNSFTCLHFSSFVGIRQSKIRFAENCVKSTFVSFISCRYSTKDNLLLFLLKIKIASKKYTYLWNVILITGGTVRYSQLFRNWTKMRNSWIIETGKYGRQGVESFLRVRNIFYLFRQILIKK